MLQLEASGSELRTPVFHHGIYLANIFLIRSRHISKVTSTTLYFSFQYSISQIQINQPRPRKGQAPQVFRPRAYFSSTALDQGLFSFVFHFTVSTWASRKTQASIVQIHLIRSIIKEFTLSSQNSTHHLSDLAVAPQNKFIFDIPTHFQVRNFKTTKCNHSNFASTPEKVRRP